MFRGSILWRGLVYAMLMAIGKLFCGVWLIRLASSSGPSQKDTKKGANKAWGRRPKSLYPASLLGCAMVARGEIGFLISALAASNGTFSNNLYLIVTWAILLCTIVGPLALGILAKRVRRLRDERATVGGARETEDPLGIWGVG